jgi:branched-chain amino acid transport system substrate-binding protein
MKLSTRLSLAATLLAMASCQKKEDTIKIGLTGVQTGPDAAIGTAPINGSKLAIEEWNAKGGLLGKQIEMVVRDDEGKPKTATAVAQELISAGVAAVVGHFNSGCSIPASEIYNQAGVVQITPASTNPQLTERGFQNTFRICGRDDQQGIVSAAFARDTLKTQVVAVLNDKTAYGQGIAEVFKKTFEQMGGKVAVYEGVGSEEKDFRGAIANIQKSGATAVYWAGMFVQGGIFYNQLREAGFKGAMLGGDGLFDDEFHKTTQGKADSVFLTFGPDYTSKPEAQDFLKKYRAKFGPEGSYSIYGYDAANVLLAAMAKAGTTDAQAVSQALRSQSWKTLGGEVAFDAKGDLKAAGYVIWTARQGKFVAR